MRNILLFLGVCLSVSLISCEEIVQLRVPESNQFIVVDATLTNQSGPQIIRLYKSQNYFDNNNPETLKDAKVLVKDNEGNMYEFKENLSNRGVYEWNSANKVLGKIGNTYQLSIDWNGEHLDAVSKMNRVPAIDSIRYKKATANLRQSGEGKPSEGFEAHFYAVDPKGEGDCYRVKAYKNGVQFNASNNLTVMYDSNFQKGSQADGLMFILPVRSSISPELYLDGDSLKVELYSITEGQYDFYFQARQEINNAGLFSRPTANIPTNLINKNKNSTWQGAGWFGTSAISTKKIKIDQTQAVKKLF
ncbi:MAG: hypothetical protein RJA76_636 [Bacteroidota bacterium]|jgi:hypothetical protein